MRTIAFGVGMLVTALLSGPVLAQPANPYDAETCNAYAMKMQDIAREAETLAEKLREMLPDDLVPGDGAVRIDEDAVIKSAMQAFPESFAREMAEAGISGAKLLPALEDFSAKAKAASDALEKCASVTP